MLSQTIARRGTDAWRVNAGRPMKFDCKNRIALQPRLPLSMSLGVADKIGHEPGSPSSDPIASLFAALPARRVGGRRQDGCRLRPAWLGGFAVEAASAQRVAGQ